MKDKIILAVYLNVGSLEKEDVEILIDKINDNLPKDESIEYFLFPVRDGNTRMECVYPTFITDQERLDKIDAIVERLSREGVTKNRLQCWIRFINL